MVFERKIVKSLDVFVELYFHDKSSRGKKNVVTVPEFEGRDAEMQKRQRAGGAAGAAVEHHAARVCGGVHALCSCAQRGARDCAGPS